MPNGGGHPSGPEATREATPYIELDRAAWAKLAHEVEDPLTQDEISALRGLGDQLDLEEVREVYLPISRLLSLYVEAAGRLHRDRRPSSTRTRRRGRRSSSAWRAPWRSASPRPPACSAPARALAGAPPRRPGHHGRLPLPQRRARAAWTAAAQGLPGVLRPPGAAPLRGRPQVRPRRGGGTGLRPPHVRRRARREAARQAPRHRDHRGAQRAPAGTGARRRPDRPRRQRLLRLLRLRRRQDLRHPRLVRRTASSGSARRRSATRSPTSRATPPSPTTRRSPRRCGSGTRSTAPT